LDVETNIIIDSDFTAEEPKGLDMAKWFQVTSPSSSSSTPLPEIPRPVIAMPGIETERPSSANPESTMGAMHESMIERGMGKSSGGAGPRPISFVPLMVVRTSSEVRRVEAENIENEEENVV
jgi:hypothetical protein